MGKHSKKGLSPEVDPASLQAKLDLAAAYREVREDVLADVIGGITPDHGVIEANVLQVLAARGYDLEEIADHSLEALTKDGMVTKLATNLLRSIVADFRAQVLFSNQLNMALLWEHDESPLDFAIPGHMVGTVGLLVGASGGCKSTFSALVTMAIGSGRNLLNLLPADGTGQDYRPKQGLATFLNLEDHDAPLRSRVQQMLRARRDDGDFIIPEKDRLEIIQAQQHGQIAIIPRPKGGLRPFKLDRRGRVRKTRDYDVLEKICAVSRLVSVDTLNILISGAGIDENSNTQMGPVASALNETAEETGCAILIPHHPSKSDVLNGTDGGGRGAGAMKDNSRFCLTLKGMSTVEATARWPGVEGHELTRMRRSWVHAEWNKTSYSEQPYPVWFRRSGVLLEGIPQDQVPQPVLVGKEGKQPNQGADANNVAALLRRPNLSTGGKR